MIDLLIKAGILGIPLLVCSILMLAIIVDRSIVFWRWYRFDWSLHEKIVELLQQNRINQLEELLSQYSSPLTNVVRKGWELRNHPAQTVELTLSHAIQEELQELNRYLQGLATIANLAPVLGLLGTVIGMIKAFIEVQAGGGKVNASALAGGIWEAMLTTAIGLMIAIPAILFHSWFFAKLNRFEHYLERAAIAILPWCGKREGQSDHA